MLEILSNLSTATPDARTVVVAVRMLVAVVKVVTAPSFEHWPCTRHYAKRFRYISYSFQ